MDGDRRRRRPVSTSDVGAYLLRAATAPSRWATGEGRPPGKDAGVTLVDLSSGSARGDQLRTVRKIGSRSPTGVSLPDVFEPAQAASASTASSWAVDPSPDLATYMTVRARPTIEALLFGPRPVPAEMARRRASVDTGRAPARNLFGMWDGVICRNLMQIFGGTVFIQLGVVFGVAGIGPGCALYALRARCSCDVCRAPSHRR